MNFERIREITERLVGEAWGLMCWGMILRMPTGSKVEIGREETGRDIYTGGGNTPTRVITAENEVRVEVPTGGKAELTLKVGDRTYHVNANDWRRGRDAYLNETPKGDLHLTIHGLRKETGIPGVTVEYAHHQVNQEDPGNKPYKSRYTE